MIQDVTLYVLADGPGNWAVLHRVGDVAVQAETVEQAIKTQFEAGLLPDGPQMFAALGSLGLYGVATTDVAQSRDRDADDQPRRIDTLAITTVFNFQP